MRFKSEHEVDAFWWPRTAYLFVGTETLFLLYLVVNRYSAGGEYGLPIFDAGRDALYGSGSSVGILGAILRLNLAVAAALWMTSLISRCEPKVPRLVSGAFTRRPSFHRRHRTRRIAEALLPALALLALCYVIVRLDAVSRPSPVKAVLESAPDGSWVPRGSGAQRVRTAILP